MIDWEVLPEDWKSLPPRATGIYFFVDGERVVYIGKSTDIRVRVMAHHGTRSEIRSGAWSVRYHLCRRAQLRRLERECIFHYQPPSNVLMRGAPVSTKGSGPSNLSDMLLAWRLKNGILPKAAALKIGIDHCSYRGIEEGWRFRDSDIEAVLIWATDKDRLSEIAA